MAEYQDFISSLTGEEIEARLLAVPNKVDKEEGKGLSSNDYTAAEKTKLADIEQGAEKNVNPDWNATSGKAQILNKPENLVTDANYVHTDNNYTNDDKQALSGSYTKPTAGIPVYDLSADVQVSLGRADTALQPADLSDLTALVDRKAGMLVDTASGATASFTPDATIDNLLGVSVAVEPVQDLHGYDSPWPAGGKGNLLSQTAAFTQTVNGITFDSDGKGNYTISGTSTAIAVFNIPLVTPLVFPDADVYLHLCNNAISGNVAVVLLPESGETQYINKSPTAINDVAPAVNKYGSTAGRLRLYVGAGTTVNMSLSPMVMLTSTVTPFVPYSNLCPISGWTGAKIQSSGVNLIDDTLRNYTNEVLLTRGVWYAQSFVTAPSEINTRLQYFDESNYRWIDVISAPFTTDNFTITTLSGHTNPFGWMYGNQTFSISIVNPTKFRFNTTSRNGISRLSISPTQLSTFVEYAGSNQISVTFPSEAGTVYGGTLDVTNGTMTVDRVKATKRWGDGSYQTVIGTVTRKTITLPSVAVYPPTTGKPQLSSIAPYKAAYFDDSVHFYINGNSENQLIIFLPVGTSDDTEFEVSYQLATPIEIQLDPVTISTISGQTNNVWADAGDVSVEYAADLKAYIDSKIAALAAQIVNS